jgi:hypothetical protein
MHFVYQNDEQCMLNRSLIAFGKTVSRVSKLTNRGNGSTWPGHIALKGNKDFIPKQNLLLLLVPMAKQQLRLSSKQLFKQVDFVYYKILQEPTFSTASPLL